MEKKDQDKKIKPPVKVRTEQPSYIPRIAPKHLFYLGVIAVSVIFGLALPFLPTKYQPAVIVVPIGLMVGLLILVYPFVGIYLYYAYEYFRPDSFFPAIRPLKLAILLEATTLAAFLLMVIFKRIDIKWDRFNWPFVIFIGALMASVPLALNNRWAYDTFQAMLVTFIMFFLATNILNSVKRINFLIWIFLLVHFYFGFKGILNKGLVGGALMGDENDLALALNVMIPFAFFFFVDSKRGWKKFISLGIAVTMTLGVVASLSRGGWVGLIGVLTYCIIKSKRKMLSLSAIVVLGLAVAAFAPSEYWDEVRSISDTQDATAQSRLHFWKAAVRMYVDHPVIGVGGGNGGVYMPRYATGFIDINRLWGRTFHGTMPQVLAETGTIGSVAYLLMLFWALRYLWKIQKLKVTEENRAFRTLARATMGGIIGYFGSATFLSTAYYPQLWTMYMITMSLVFCLRALDKKQAALESAKDDEGLEITNEVVVKE